MEEEVFDVPHELVLGPRADVVHDEVVVFLLVGLVVAEVDHDVLGVGALWDLPVMRSELLNDAHDAWCEHISERRIVIHLRIELAFVASLVFAIGPLRVDDQDVVAEVNLVHQPLHLVLLLNLGDGPHVEVDVAGQVLQVLRQFLHDLGVVGVIPRVQDQHLLPHQLIAHSCRIKDMDIKI